MKKIKKIVVLFVMVVLVLSTFIGCNKNGKNSSGEKEEITLLVDMHGWMPTINTTPTLEVPKVLNAPRLIAEEFTKQTGIKIKWARSKPVGGGNAEVGEWFTTQIAADSCPAIAFSWGTMYQDRDYYWDLTQYMNQPNPYVEGNEKWSDLWEDYLVQDDMRDAIERIVAVPISLYPGPATGYYYNKDIFENLNLAVPSTYEEFVAVAKSVTAGGYTSVAPWSFFKKYGLDQWIVQFAIGAPIAGSIKNLVDTDGDGLISTREEYTAVFAGLYNPVEHDYAKEVYYQTRRYFKEVLPAGWLSTDYMNAWDTGSLGMKEDGIWHLYDEYNYPARTYDFGVFPVPILQADTKSLVPGNEANSVQVAPVEYTNGPFEPGMDLSLNIMKPAVENDPEMLDAAVKFLQFITQPEYITMLCEEQGSALGAVKGSGYNSILDDYLNQQFAKGFNISWPTGYTSSYKDKMDRSFGLWVLGQKSDADFFNDVNNFTRAGAKAQAEAMGIDLKAWGINA